MRRTLVSLLTAGALVLTAGCGGGGDPLEGGDKEGGASGTITVGAANFPENQLLAEIYAQVLEAEGVKVSRKMNVGTREAYIPALKDGSIDLLPEYTGSLLEYQKKGHTEDATDPEKVYEQAQASLPKGFELLDMSSAEDKDAVVVTQQTADKYDLTLLSDLKPHAPKMVLGGPPEWEKRYNGVEGLREVYGLKFKNFKKLDVAGPISVKALKDGQVDAVNLFTTQSAIEQNNFVALEDPENLYIAQNVTPLINSEKADAKTKKALNAVSAKLTTDKLKKLVAEVEVDKKDAATVAKQFIDDNGLAK
ncbi:MAG: glycine/betaine ABC transporter substrate-binding protein [Streptosporangiales bacterium]|nr:glycine/betaine ABC transporter substrate-binding protein [Streptosporangiales bacterium]